MARPPYPVVADPESYEINRLQLTNTSIIDTTITLGRQRIVLDDHRFVGNVGWRQNEQTFDALRVVNKHIPNLTIDAVTWARSTACSDRMVYPATTMGASPEIPSWRTWLTSSRSASSPASAT